MATGLINTLPDLKSVIDPLTTQQPATTPGAPGTTTPATPGSIEPAKIEVTPDQTVEGRTAGIIASGSPLMQQAETRAKEAANERGLLNSSMAVGAGQGAVLDQATKIAGQDANTFANAATNNAQAANVFRAADQKFGHDTQLLGIQRASNKEIAQIEATYKNLTQASASAASILNTLSGNVARVMENTTMDAPAKQRAVDIYNTNTSKALQLIGALNGDLDLSSYLDEVLGTAPAAAAPTTVAPTTVAPAAPTAPAAPAYVPPTWNNSGAQEPR